MKVGEIMANFLKLKKSNCKNCYKCIRHCPVKAINFSDNQAHIVHEQCILCGQCFVVCPQNAKEIVSEVDNVKVMLNSNDTVIASIAPSFIANYNSVGIDSIRTALKKLGFADAFETAVGATIVTNEYERMLKEENRDIIITSCCHSVNLLIQKYFPNELKYLADVVSPMQAHCKYIKQKYNNAKTVFIGPCVAKKDEGALYSDDVDAVLTFEELTEWLQEEGIGLKENIDNTDESRARFYPTSGGIIKTITEKSPKYTYISIDGTENCMAVLKDIEKGKIHNCFIEMSACVGSCIGGPVMEKFHDAPLEDYLAVSNYAGEKPFDVIQPNSDDLRKEFEFIDCNLLLPSERQIVSILKQMGKTSPEDELNCGSCGYNSCREKAIAIYQGKADISMCLPYLSERAKNFSDNIVNNTPNGLIVLNEDLEIQQINSSAQDILNIHNASDVLGEQVIRILDPTTFMDVRDAQKNIIRENIYLAEYNRYVEQTIIYDPVYRIFICIFQDITNEELEREKKENITNKTVEIADKLVEKQMRTVQDIASLLGETTAETKIALSKLKESILNE